MRSVYLLSMCLLLAPLSSYADGPCSSAPYKAFDFWVGTWKVHSREGEFQGENEIRREEGTCLLVERWRSRNGGTGQSYNFYDPAHEVWRQLWVSQGAVIDYRGNLTKDGAMRLEGTIRYQADGREAEFVGTWTPQADGSVLQEFKERNADTGEWQDWFTGVYTRAKG